MEMKEVSERYTTPCFVDDLNAYDGEVNLEYKKNIISNKFTVKLCLEYEVKNGEKVMKRELLVSLRGEKVVKQELLVAFKKELEDGEIEEEEEVVEVEEGVEYFDKFPTKDELAYHKYLLHDPSPPFYRRYFLIVEDIGSAIDHCLSHVVLGKSFFKVSNMTYDPSTGMVKFTDGVDEVAYQMSHRIEQF
ncbi:hypothetical protein Tco_0873428 [Tanacetum coccineum]|uniref:Uncharacterized protein n=1 Tax=Tanacetum coccineum TaxID=301880 RepID=A0ABQ5BLM1_9ASTR